MGPTEPRPEVVAATDAVFEEGSPTVAEPQPPAAPPAPPAPGSQARPRDGADSPLHDYVRELGEEYQRQQDEGKVEP